MSPCLQCGNQVKTIAAKYCSNQCQLDFQYNSYIQKWKEGKIHGNRGVRAKNISRHLRRYLADKYGNVCSICGWSEVNLLTGRVPLEVDHIDGNWENNVEANLRLICPNCHSLTTSYRNLNKGHGREWRKLKYIKVNK